MNIFIWILQIALALWNITGSLYMLSHYEELASDWAFYSLSPPIWMLIGGFQIIFSLGLLIPGGKMGIPKLQAISALGLAMISLLGLVLFSAYKGFPGMLWAIIPAGIAACIAYKRM